MASSTSPTALTPILKQSQSADGLSCLRSRRTLHESDSVPLFKHKNCPASCQTCNVAEQHRSPPGACWGALSAALLHAFDQSADVSPHHPAAACMSGLDSAALARDLADQQCWVGSTYTRTTVLKGAGFEAMLLCWPPQVCSPVHAHSDAESGVKSNCFMAVLEGELSETVYSPAEVVVSGGQVVGSGTTRTMAAGAYAYINDEYGVHKVGNTSRATPAISLHVYAPGWRTVQTFEETDAGGAPIDADCWGDF